MIRKTLLALAASMMTFSAFSGTYAVMTINAPSSGQIV